MILSLNVWRATVLRIRLAHRWSTTLLRGCNPDGKSPAHATGLHSARSEAPRSPMSRFADRIFSTEARRRPRSSLSFYSIHITHLDPSAMALRHCDSHTETHGDSCDN